MVKVLIAIACSLPILLQAQGFGSYTFDQPFLAKEVASSGVAPIAGTEFWWSFTSLVTNEQVLAWSDKLVGKVMTGIDGNQITNRSNGVAIEAYNNAANRLTNALLGGPFSAATDNYGLGLIINVRPNAAAFDNHPLYCQAHNNYVHTDASGTPGAPFFVDREPAASMGRFNTNLWQDVLCATISGGGAFATNGIVAVSGIGSGLPRFSAIGNNNLASGTKPVVMDIRDIFVFTNITSASVLASNLHYYRTNTYP